MTKLSAHERMTRLVRAYRHARRRERLFGNLAATLVHTSGHGPAWQICAMRHERAHFAADLCGTLYLSILHMIGGER